MDDATGWCLGCGRTRDELVGWGSRSPEERGMVWRALPARLDALGVELRRPDWDSAAVRDALLERFHMGGEWSICGCGGFSQVAIRDPDPAVEGAILTVREGAQAVRIKVDKHLRAFRHPDPAREADALLLGVLQLRLPDTRSDVLTEVGPDKKAILPADAGGVLFDLGFGFPPARFMLRTADPVLQQVLRALEGAPLADVLAEAGDALEAAQPTRVAQSVGARIETAAPLPSAAGSGDGYAARLAAAVKQLSETPAPLDLGDAHGPVALYRALLAQPH